MKINKKGISLIVLVITIIVMIILATAIVLSLTSNNIVDNAKEATSASDIANAKQLVRVAEAEWKMEPEGTLEEYINNKLLEAGYKLSGNGAIKVSKSGAVNTLYVDKNDDQAIIPDGFVASQATGEDIVSAGLVIYEGTEPVTNKNVLEARLTRNQFVWVPVPKYDKFSTTTTYDGNTITRPGENYREPLILAGDPTGEYAEAEAMYNSVEENGGFYIGRYEAGTSTARTSNADVSDVLIQKNKEVYNFAHWGTSSSEVGDTGAVALARSVYDSASVKSTLCYGVQWDATLNFIATSGITDSNFAKNSTNKGNYTKIKAKTGSNDSYALNNIYDMAGNVWEWTMESHYNDYRVLRGGSMDNTPDSSAAYARLGKDIGNPVSRR